MLRSTIPEKFITRVKRIGFGIYGLVYIIWNNLYTNVYANVQKQKLVDYECSICVRNREGKVCRHVLAVLDYVIKHKDDIDIYPPIMECLAGLKHQRLLTLIHNALFDCGNDNRFLLELTENIAKHSNENLEGRQLFLKDRTFMDCNKSSDLLIADFSDYTTKTFEEYAISVTIQGSMHLLEWSRLTKSEIKWFAIISKSLLIDNLNYANGLRPVDDENCTYMLHLLTRLMEQGMMFRNKYPDNFSLNRDPYLKKTYFFGLESMFFWHLLRRYQKIGRNDKDDDEIDNLITIIRTLKEQIDNDMQRGNPPERESSTTKRETITAHDEITEVCHFEMQHPFLCTTRDKQKSPDEWKNMLFPIRSPKKNMSLPTDLSWDVYDFELKKPNCPLQFEETFGEDVLRQPLKESLSQLLCKYHAELYFFTSARKINATDQPITQNDIRILKNIAALHFKTILKMIRITNVDSLCPNFFLPEGEDKPQPPDPSVSELKICLLLADMCQHKTLCDFRLVWDKNRQSMEMISFVALVRFIEILTNLDYYPKYKSYFGYVKRQFRPIVKDILLNINGLENFQEEVFDSYRNAIQWDADKNWGNYMSKKHKILMKNFKSFFDIEFIIDRNKRKRKEKDSTARRNSKMIKQN